MGQPFVHRPALVAVRTDKVPRFYIENSIDFLKPAVVFHSIILVNLFCYSFLLGKGKNNLTCTAYRCAASRALHPGNRKKHFTTIFFQQLLLIASLLTIFIFPLAAQDSTRMSYPDSGKKIAITSGPYGGVTLHPVTNKGRIRLVAISSGVAYGALLVGLNAEWYANYPRSGFHFFDDNAEWMQVDKVGHMYSAYIESRMSMEAWRWTGIDRKKRIWYGGLSGAVYQTVIETLDGFSTEWGWSWGDFSANILGSGALIAQELAWNGQRIKLKFSFHKNSYKEPDLTARANDIFGKSITERFIKDYNAQTYWASANLKAFLPESNLPPWLAVAVGYGAEGMFGARSNVAKDDNGSITFDRSDIRRYRQWYLSPDIDFSKIKTNKKGVRLLFTVLSAFKFPAPSLEFSKGRFKFNVLHF